MDHNEQHDSEHVPTKRKEMSRRQFLTYTLGGAGAFMAGGVILPMVRFAVDPILQKKEASGFIKVIEESKITSEPMRVEFQIHQVDGWYESDPKLAAWISKGDDGQVFALSPICKHLGCVVSWGGESPDEYHCPCHGAKYTKDGKTLKVAPKSLDEYQVQLDNGWVYLGPIVANTRVK
ncbi:MAG: ubiquinol-cytochrome c reductase iron-sulfur subunit [Candidatus Cohnella colombiensis]|uniref:Ubiquinol-cytochrome c reductase iron-sulfur subunit n=1 Tax=Candidatus Cohnella colombiensis TaxID=3121368 RepID=A0AA95JCY2_9BACL|nr:MAG: ubiquinol-cytochrome c reductase iron-sulfur subunit [Cohnella sp.]